MELYLHCKEWDEKPVVDLMVLPEVGHVISIGGGDFKGEYRIYSISHDFEELSRSKHNYHCIQEGITLHLVRAPKNTEN